MFKIIESELLKVVSKAVNHAQHKTNVEQEDTQLTPEAGALVRDVGKERAMASLQLRRSLGSLSFAQNLAKCVSQSAHRRRLK
jgi:hypothetical protein